MTEFYVDTIACNGLDLTLTGVISDGTIRVGMVFESLYSSSQKNEIATKPKIQLSVRKISAYGKDFEELERGMSATIGLTGSGGEHIRPKDIMISFN